MDPIKASNGEVVTTPVVPSRPGYIFEGWYSDKDMTEPFVFPHEIKASDPKNIILYGLWLGVSGIPQDSSGGDLAADYLNEPVTP